ncbi:hypothetical protein SCP_0412450 [Sparassis crispa]|uniref:BTB domain-containing protein n=1 Tax=Sparassis crispa TaxID=139825 RepID=A0A401GL11_9APHY|nr:hypothetical protein SCP_0412450 [Sparassis crispa]GBE82858.1 hypothetical protein SCP_0412450 [Sparassis crispa]
MRILLESVTPVVLKSAKTPRIQLSDSALDIEHLFTMLYDSQRYFSLSSGPVEFSMVLSLIRLGHKYEMTTLRDGALERLKTCFPADFEEWCELDEDGSAYVTMKPEDAIAAVNLAHLTQTDSVLPSALYGCCSLDTHTLLHGMLRTDGSSEKLSQEDLERCVEGRVKPMWRVKLMEANTRELRWVLKLDQASPACSQKWHCTVKLRELPAKAHREAHGSFYALTQWNAVFQLGVCDKCADMVTAAELEGRRKVWSKLPSLMGVTVEGWGSDS